MKHSHIVIGFCLWSVGSLLLAANPVSESKFKDARKFPFRADPAIAAYSGSEFPPMDMQNARLGDLVNMVANHVGIALKIEDPKLLRYEATYRFQNKPWDQIMDIMLKEFELAYVYDGKTLTLTTVAKARRQGLLE